LHHYRQQQSEQLKVNDQLKSLFKERGFKWKTVRNETDSGMRIEVMEATEKKILAVKDTLLYAITT
jgi:hypothetical protein